MSEAAAQPWYDEGSAAAPHGLYRFDAAAPGIRGLDGVGQEQADFFREQGYLLVHDAFDGSEVASAREALLDLVDGRVSGFRGVQFEASARGRLDSLTAEEKQDHVRKLWLFVAHEPRLRAIAEHPGLLRAARLLCGDEPVLFQDQAMLKPPMVGREKPWHQDNAYFNVAPDTCVVGVWIALDQAGADNGCMHIVPGSHREGPVVHFRRRDWQICDDHVDAARDVMAVLQPGGCLFFHGLLHHGTPPNRSPKRRRALQFHYRPANASPITGDERMAVFGSEGKDVTC